MLQAEPYWGNYDRTSLARLDGSARRGRIRELVEGQSASQPEGNRRLPQEVEFVVVNFFDSLESVKRFAGPDYSVPVFEPEARRLLRTIEPVAMHYEVRASTV
jgi:hypothetical protein